MKIKSYIWALLLFFIIPNPNLCAQKGFGSENYISKYLYSKPIDRNQYRIDKITFEGNQEFSDFELSSLIISKVTSKSLPHTIIEYYNDNLSELNSTPKYVKYLLVSALKGYSTSIYYFIESQADNDIATIQDYYNKFGFHDVEVKFAFYPDTSTSQNVLAFHIKENIRYSVGEFIYSGIKDLPKDLEKKANNIRKVESGDYFSEPKILNEVNQISDLLHNNGYLDAKFKFDQVTIDPAIYQDTISINFETGKRFKIDKIYYIDSTRGQKAVASDMKNMSLTFKSGEWYSRKKLRQSENNLNELGVFESVIFDTTNVDYTDSLLNIKIFTEYKKLKNWNGAFFVNQTTEANNYYNFGVEGDFSYKNIFGAAENFSIYGNTTVRNYSGKIFPSFNDFQMQGRFGLLFSQPLFLVIDNTKFGLETRFEYELSRYRDLLLRKISLPRARIPFRFPSVTYLNRGYFEFILEEERPMDEITITSNDIDQNIFQYALLQEYFENNPYFLPTALIFGVATIGDNKDNPFSPSTGNYSFISVDFGLLSISQYARFIFQRHDYFSNSLKKNAVHATKFKIGNIFLLNKESFVPFDRQFYAGGANSIRGWTARTLHPYDVGFWENPESFPEGTDIKKEFEDFSNLIGNGGIIELSYEYRYRFKKPEDMTPAIAEQLANLGFALFVDVGNAFNWYASNVNTPILEYFIPENWAYSVGAGIRYETPIGPIRLDIAMPIYGPVYGRNDWIGSRENILSDIQWHISIGNPF